MNRKYKRKQYFVEKSFQTKFIFKFCIVVVISSFFIGGLIFFLSQDSTTVTIENTEVKVKRTADFILPIIVTTVIVVSSFSSVIVLILTLFVSHRIAGPLFRMKREIDGVKEGDLTKKFNLREKDQFREVAASLGGMCDTLRGKYVTLKTKCHELKDYVGKGDFSSSGEEKERLSRMVDEIEDTLNQFKV